MFLPNDIGHLPCRHRARMDMYWLVSNSTNIKWMLTTWNQIPNLQHLNTKGIELGHFLSQGRLQDGSKEKQPEGHSKHGGGHCVSRSQLPMTLLSRKSNKQRQGLEKRGTSWRNVCLLLIWALLWLLVTVTMNIPTSSLNCLPVGTAVWALNSDVLN